MLSAHYCLSALPTLLPSTLGLPHLISSQERKMMSSRMTFQSLIMSLSLLLTNLIISASAHAVIFNLPATDDDGNFTISWSEGKTYTHLYELNNGQTVGSPIYGSGMPGTYTFNVTGKPEGTYEYGLNDCERIHTPVGVREGCNLISKTITVSFPAIAPTNFSAAVSNTKINLSWSASSGTKTYEIQRNNKVLTTVPGTTYSDTLVTPATAYTYRIRACKISTNCSAWISSNSATIPAIPTSPASISATPNGQSVFLSWPSSSGATSYELQRNNATIKTFNTTSYSDPSGVGTFTYRVRACNGTGCSGWTTSSQVAIVVAPVQVANLNASISGPEIALNWSPITGATRYEIQRNSIALATPTNTTYTDLTAIPNTAYIYQIRACNSAGCSAWRASNSITIPPIPGIPASISATIDGVNAKITWSSSSGATRYDLQKNGSGISSANITSFTDTAVALGVSYTYRIRACNGTGCSGWLIASTLVIPYTAFDFNTQAPSLFSYSLTTSGLPNLTVNQMVATTQGNLSIQNGATIYSIPIELPPAVRGLKPKLTLNYNSRSGNGLMGVGWGLGGLSAITRCRANYATEKEQAQKPNPRYSTGDRLCLDGQKLVVSNLATPANDASYWAMGQEYKTEIDSFTKIVAYSSSANGGHGYFKAWTKDGRILTYGEHANTRNSKIYAANQYNGPVRIWALDKVEDAYGNNYTITYDQSHINGEYYPLNINLGSTGLVVFSYKNRYGQTPWGYDVGNKYQFTKVLEKIATYGSSSTPAKEYRINYKLSQTTNRELVNTIQECGYESTSLKCARPLTFGWQVGELGFDQTPTSVQVTGGNISTYAFDDADGDGYVDSIGELGIGAWGAGDGQFRLPGYTFDRIKTSTEELNFESFQLVKTRSGKAGIVTKSRYVYSGGKKYTDVYLARFTPTTTTVTYTLLHTIDKSNVPVVVGDFNNDALDDFVFGEYMWIQNSTSSSPVFSKSAIAGNSMGVAVEPSILDFNNDGLGDLTYVWNGRSTQGMMDTRNLMQGHANKGNYFNKKADFYFYANPVMPGVRPGDPNGTPVAAPGVYKTLVDLNGDGLKDYLYQHIKPGSETYQNTDKWYVRFANGNTTPHHYNDETDTGIYILNARNVSIHGSTSIKINTEYSFAYDYNKDGIEDIILLTKTDPGQYGNWYVIYATHVNGQLTFTNSGIDPFHGKADYLIDLPVAGSRDNMFRGDVNNDGLIDIIIQGKIYLAKQQQPDLINKITNGFGVVTKLFYSPLTGDANNGQPLYTPETTPPTFPQLPVNRAMQVVKKASTSNGVGGFNHTYYHYHGGRQDIHRGFAGFKSTTITNATTGVSSITEYRQDWPYNGRISKQTVKDTNGKLISVVNNGYAIHSQNARFPFLSYSLQKNYELTTTNESLPIGVSKTINVFDTCGNVTEKTTTIGKGFSGTEIAGELSSQRTINVYDYDGTTSNCSDDFLTRTTQEFSKADGNDSKTIITEFTPNSQRDILTRTDFKNDAIQSTTTYAYETNGVVSSVTEVAKDFDGTDELARVTSFSNFAYGIYPQTITNAKGHQATLTYDYRFGTIKTEAVLGQVTTNTYDALGRQIAVKTPDSAVTVNTSFYCSNAPVTCPSDAYYGVAAQTTHSSQAGKLGSPLTMNFYDALQREVRSVSYGLDGKVVNQATEYLNSGYLKRISEPYSTHGIYADTSSAFAWTVFSNYDSLGRANTVTGADGGRKTTTYSTSTEGLVVTDSILVIKPNGGSETQASSRTLNALGQVVNVEDALFNTVNYVYDSLGNLERTQVNNNVATQINITHDLAGNKTFISDPDAGNIHFAYNGHGELRKQTWQQGVSGIEKSITWDYDQLGRQISRLDRLPNGSTTAYSWLWDTRQQGQLTSRTGNGFTEEYFYDGFSRLSRRIVTTAGLSGGEFIYTYDNFSRPTTMTYPNGFKIQREYHAAGYQTKTTDVTHSASPKVLWTLGNTIDTRGNFNRQLWGNGVVTQTEFDTTSGHLSSIKSGRLSGANQVTNLYGDIQNLSYTFDSLGNLYSRTTARTNNSGAVQETIIENFAYDKLNRLTHSTTSGLFGRTQTYQYDTGGLGNLVNRTDTLTGSSVNNDVGTLAYDRVRNAGIHAVTSAGGINYSYDRYGNMTARGSEILTYDVFNKPTRIAGTTTTDFFYGPDHELYKQISGGVTTYKLAGGVYEVTANGSTTTQKSYVDGVILNTRTLVNGTQTANDTQYLHGDHLGSTEAITNTLGQFVSRMSFSTWGERQKTDWKPGPLTSTELNTYNAITTNGYTGHDQLDSHNLIHMGGRVYDPNLGRFLSADLFIQSPYNSQSFNRYSYTFNNPLSYTDPTGYMSNMMQYFMNASYHQSASWQWATTTSYVHATHWTTAATINPDGTLSDTRNGVDLSTVNSVSAGSIFQTVSYNVPSWGAGPFSVPNYEPGIRQQCGSDAQCAQDIRTDMAELHLGLMSLAVGGEGLLVAKLAWEIRAAKLTADALKTGKLVQNKMFKDAVSQFKNTDLTNAGRALSKHPEITGQTKDSLRQILRSDSSLNKAAANELKNIMRNGSRSESNLPRYGDTVTYQIPGGSGARFEAATNKFIGFINP